MLVKATRTGYYGLRLRVPGEVFRLTDRKHFSDFRRKRGRRGWMLEVPEGTPEGRPEEESKNPLEPELLGRQDRPEPRTNREAQQHETDDLAKSKDKRPADVPNEDGEGKAAKTKRKSTGDRSVI